MKKRQPPTWEINLDMMEAAAEYLKAGESLSRQTEAASKLMGAIRAKYGAVSHDVADAIATFTIERTRPLMHTTFIYQTADERVAQLLNLA